ncbi:MAG: chromate transporter [Pontiellaceae bacterium]|nr:chromate transporter [Pontiellaceae bacterium]
MAENPERPTLLELFFVFMRVSAFTIGGGFVMFPLMKREVVDDKEWISDEEMVDYYALGQSIPGVIAMNTATLIGYRKRGVCGALAAAIGMAAPSVVVILLVAAFLAPYFDSPLVQKAFSGIRAAVVALIVMALYKMAGKSVNSVMQLALGVGAFLSIVALQIHPVLVIAAGGILGLTLFQKKEKEL